MDFSSIATAIASLKSAQELASATLAVRDFNQSAAAIAQINEKLLGAQQGLLAHNTMLLQLQSEYFQATEELRKLKEAVAEKDSYDLVDLGGGVFVLEAHIAPDEGGSSVPGRTQPKHYVCQPCFAGGSKVVLQHNGDYWRCNGCNAVYQANPRSTQSVMDALDRRDSYFP